MRMYVVSRNNVRVPILQYRRLRCKWNCNCIGWCRRV